MGSLCSLTSTSLIACPFSALRRGPSSSASKKLVTTLEKKLLCFFVTDNQYSKIPPAMQRVISKLTKVKTTIAEAFGFSKC